jgi:hypothetical protein
MLAESYSSFSRATAHRRYSEGQRKFNPLPFHHEKLDTELDLECLLTQPTPKNLWKIWKAGGKERMRRKRLPEKKLRRRSEKTLG